MKFYLSNEILPGSRFGRLIVMTRAKTIPTRGCSPRRYIVLCDCGNYRTVRATNLRSGNSTSCGCSTYTGGNSQAPERCIQRVRDWRRANREKDRALKKRYREKYPGKIAAKTRRRQAMKMNATPAWANKEEIEKIYEEAARLRGLGQDVEVDHIIPLNGKNICGLHIETNLQIITAAENRLKGARYENY